jgi:putative Mg2+ transporter-C (MgtC) family protein
LPTRASDTHSSGCLSQAGRQPPGRPGQDRPRAQHGTTPAASPAGACEGLDRAAILARARRLSGRGLTSITVSLGLRTFPLVAVASCTYVLIVIGAIGENSDAQSRIIQGLMTGIGFVGGGAILKNGDRVRGTATAASIWTTGGMGAAVAYDMSEIAIILSIINYLIFRVLTPIERRLGSHSASEESEPQTSAPDGALSAWLWWAARCNPYAWRATFRCWLVSRR